MAVQPLTPEEQAAYGLYIQQNPSEIPRLEKMSVTALKTFLADWITAEAPALTTVVAPQFTSVAPVDTDFFQPAYGVTGGRQASRQTGQPISGTYTGFKTSYPGDTFDRRPPIEPRYFQGDEDLLNTLSRTEIMTIQTKMKQAGILGKYRLGVVDDATSAAFTKVLGQANRIGGDYMQGLAVLQQTSETGDGVGVRVANPDDLKKVIDQSARLVLGRSVDPAMSDRLVQAYQQLQRQQSAPDAGVFAEKKIKQNFGAEADAYKFAEYANIILGGQ